MPDLDDLIPPPPRRTFHDQLWEKLAEAERAAARRWRAVAVVAAAIAVAGTASAGVLAFGGSSPSVVDRTLACPAPRNVLDVFAHVKGPSINVYNPGLASHSMLVPHPALVELDAGRFVASTVGVWHVIETTYAGAYAGASLTQKAGYTLDGSVCHVAKQIPFSPSGLRPAGAHVEQACAIANPATFRMRVTLAKSGLPVAAKLALRSGKGLRPIAYVEWTPTRVKAWLARGCQTYSGKLAP
jgi:hypothetical protein